MIQPLVLGPARNQQLRKPVLVIIITDGEPTGESHDCVRQVIVGSKRFLEQSPLGPGAIAYQFAQVDCSVLCEVIMLAIPPLTKCNPLIRKSDLFSISRLDNILWELASLIWSTKQGD